MSERQNPPTSLEAEILALHAQLTELRAERDELHAELQCTREALRAEQQQAIRLLLSLPAAIGYLRGHDMIIEFANARYLELTGVRDAVGKPLLEVLPELEAQGFGDLVRRVYQTGEPYVGLEAPGPKLQNEGAEPVDGWYDVVYQPVRGPSGDIEGVLAQVTDVTDRVMAQQKLERLSAERSELQEELIRTQQAALRELATPLVPLADGVIAMPLVGTIDPERADQILEVLLRGVDEQGARVALIDVTGVRTMDEQVAAALIRAARAAQLLGAEVVLTGLGPDVAHTLVSLGIDFGGITTLRSLQAGITHALRQGGRRERADQPRQPGQPGQSHQPRRPDAR